jgi:transcriptional regulator with XRE-family HTH domain
MSRLRLRELREEHGLSIRGLAKKARISPGHLHQIETEQVSPSLTTLDKLAKALGVATINLIVTTTQSGRKKA